MILKSDEIARLLENSATAVDPLVVTPLPELEALSSSGAASLDLRLGTWFIRLRQTRSSVLDLSSKNEDAPDDPRLTELSYVPFGNDFILHPRRFALGVTLEWIRLPRNLAGYVIGRSSWGRRGLIIATAVGVHPGFTGCLTLELSNVGEMPIKIQPGLSICQLFLHRVESKSDHVDRTAFVGLRRPTLGQILPDPIVQRLRGTSS